MRTIMSGSLILAATFLLAACTSPAATPSAQPIEDATVSAVANPDAVPVPAKFTLVDLDPDRSVKDATEAGFEAKWTSPTKFTVLTGGGGNCFDQPSTIVAPDSLSIEVVYEPVGGPDCTANFRLYLHEIEIPEGITGNTPVTLTVTFPAANENIDELTETTTIS